MKLSPHWALSLSLAVVGCAAAHRSPATRPLAAATQPASQPAVSRVPLERLTPVLTLADAPASGPATQPSLDALELFAQAREAQLANQRYTAINLLEKALELDPQSVELNASLGRAYLTSGGPPDRGIAAFENVRRLDPQNLEAYVELARAYQSRNDTDETINRLRLARLTSGYKSNDPLAAVVDYRLGVALQQAGLDQAAVDSYQSLLNRLQHGAGQNRSTPEVSYLLARPEPLFEEIAKLYEKLGNTQSALEIYQTVAEQSPNDFDAQQRVVRTQLKLHRQEPAQQQAMQLVRQFHASSESLALLRDAYQSRGGSFAAALVKLHADQPKDNAILFALTDTLAADGKVSQARQYLAETIRNDGDDVELIERAWRLEVDRGDLPAAAVLLIRASADHPEITSELAPMFSKLLGVSRAGALRLASIEKLPIPADAEAARQFWIFQTATIFQRTISADVALQKSLAANKPFDPAYRAALIVQHRKANSDADLQAFADQLAKSATDKGRADLGLELQGTAAIYLKQPARAIDLIAQAIKAAPVDSPDRQLAMATALQNSGNGPRYEQAMWKLISDHPRFDQAYVDLGEYYRRNNSAAQASEVDEKWLAAAPDSVPARLQQVTDLIVEQRIDDSAVAMLRLFAAAPDDAQVIATTAELFKSLNQSEKLIALFEAERAKHPGNVLVVDSLVSIYSTQKNSAAAQADLAATRTAVAKDPDLLYYLASIYQKIDDTASAESVLLDVLKIKPDDAQAGNDLGYTWADAGKNLPQAEKYIRLAVAAEPDNTSYLDSLGWVLYKRGLFAEARTQLDAATKPAELADPIVLDHFGDTLYRLKQPKEAAAAWTQSLQKARLVQREDLKELPAKLQRKLQQLTGGATVEVAPTVDQPTSKPSAFGTEINDRDISH